MSDAVKRWRSQMESTSPGPGKDMEDDGLGAPLKNKSIPNVSTGRLNRSLSFYHGAIHTQEGLHRFDDTKRSLVETGMKARAITHELKLRGQESGDCPHCWGG